MGGGRKQGTSGMPAKPHPYAGDERLAHVLADLSSGIQPSSADLKSRLIRRQALSCGLTVST